MNNKSFTYYVCLLTYINNAIAIYFNRCFIQKLNFCKLEIYQFIRFYMKAVYFDTTVCITCFTEFYGEELGYQFTYYH